MRTTYIQSARIYPSPRNPQIHVTPTVRIVPRSYGGSHTSLMLNSKTTTGFYANKYSSNLNLDSAKTSFQVSKDRILDSDNSKEKDKEKTTASVASPSTFSPKKRYYIRTRKGPQYTPPTESIEAGVTRNRFLHSPVIVTRSGAKEEEKEISHTVNNFKQKALALVQNYSLDAWNSLKETLTQLFDDLSDSLHKLDAISNNRSTLVSPTSNCKKALENINAKFAQIHQSIWLSNATINVHCDKLGIRLKALGSSLKVAESGEDEESLVDDYHRRVRSQTPTGGKGMPDLSKIAEAQKDLAKLFVEIKKKNEMVKLYEDLFRKKDELIHSIAPSNESVLSPISVCKDDASSLEKEKEILKLRAELQVCEFKGGSRTSGRFEESGTYNTVASGKLHEGITIFLSTMEKLKEAVTNREEPTVIENYKQALEDQKQALHILLVEADKKESPHPDYLVYTETMQRQAKEIEYLRDQCSKMNTKINNYKKNHETLRQKISDSSKDILGEVQAILSAPIQTQAKRISSLTDKLKLCKTALVKLKRPIKRVVSSAQLTEQVQELRQSLMKVTASKAVIHKELMNLRKRNSTPELPATDIRTKIKRVAMRTLAELHKKQAIVESKVECKLNQVSSKVERILSTLKEGFIQKEIKRIINVENKKTREVANTLALKNAELQEMTNAYNLLKEKHDAIVVECIKKRAEDKKLFKEGLLRINALLAFKTTQIATTIDKYKATFENCKKTLNLVKAQFKNKLKTLEKKLAEKEHSVSKKDAELLQLQNTFKDRYSAIVNSYRGHIQRAVKNEEFFGNKIWSIKSLLNTELSRAKAIIKEYKERLEEMAKCGVITKIRRKLKEKENMITSTSRNQAAMSRKTQELLEKLKNAEHTTATLQQKTDKGQEEHKAEVHELSMKISGLEEEVRLFKATAQRKELENGKLAKMLSDSKRRLEIKNYCLATLKRRIIEQLSCSSSVLFELKEEIETIKETHKDYAHTILNIIPKIKATIKSYKAKVARKVKIEVQQTLRAKDTERGLHQKKIASIARTVKKAMSATRVLLEKAKETSVSGKKLMTAYANLLTKKINERITSSESEQKVKLRSLKLKTSKAKLAVNRFKAIYKNILSEYKSLSYSYSKQFLLIISIIRKKYTEQSVTISTKLTGEVSSLRENLKSTNKKYWDLVASTTQQITTLKSQNETEQKLLQKETTDLKERLEITVKELKDLRSENKVYKKEVISLKNERERCKNVLLEITGNSTSFSPATIHKVKELEYKLINVIGLFHKLSTVVQDNKEVETEPSTESLLVLHQQITSLTSKNKSLEKLLEKIKTENIENTRVISQATNELSGILEKHGVKSKRLLPEVLKELHKLLQNNTEVGTILKLQAQLKEKDTMVLCVEQQTIDEGVIDKLRGKAGEIISGEVGSFAHIEGDQRRVHHSLVQPSYWVLLLSLTRIGRKKHACTDFAFFQVFHSENLKLPRCSDQRSNLANKLSINYVYFTALHGNNHNDKWQNILLQELRHTKVRSQK
eukprot:TRINITY_DN3789_c0_g2_i1.p1 TRINITY_DN3789_c0_g2~~TRINITY_DN3789_c0_g2_i1.p1  ORF type:complete len:1538 (+),score=198.76 TRINITY_DN3789_c0_g2_i1:65-4615(+)